MHINKIYWPIAIILASAILGGFFYASQVNKQQSIERQQILKLEEQKRNEETKKDQAQTEYIAKRKNDCYDIEKTERKAYNNVNGSYYRGSDDVCVVTYTTNEWEGYDCKVLALNPEMYNLCKSGLSSREF